MTDDKMIDLKTLAGRLGVGYSTTRAMKKAGMPLPGGKTTEGDARKWLKQHPGFRVKDWLTGKATTLPWGLDIRYHPDETIGASIWRAGVFDISVSETIWRLLDEGEHVLDVGANIGYVSALLLARIPDAHTLSIEPQPTVAALLRHNLNQFDAERWEVVEAGLSDRRADGFMKVDGANAGGGRLVSEAGEANAIGCVHAGS